MTRPACFSSESYPAALAATKASGGLLVVDATASWCEPCKTMDQVTWSDARVTDWLLEHATALQVDVEVEEALATSLRIKSMPTVIAFRGGEEVDRVSGLQQAEALLDWLEGVLRGETSLDRARGAAAKEPLNMQLRYRFASKLAAHGKLDEATDELAWLWEHMLEHQVSMAGVRLSYLVNEMAQLTRRHPLARERFAALRDAMKPQVDADTATAAELTDWAALCTVLGEEEPLLEWLARRATRAPRSEDDAILSRRIIPLLRRRGRWADIGHLHGDVLRVVARAHEQATHAPPAAATSSEMVAELRRHGERTFRDTVAMLTASLRAAGRATDANAVVAEARRLMPGDELEAAITRVLEESQGGREPEHDG